MRPVGIGETLRRVLAKLVIRAARDQAKTACGNLQLRAGLEDGIEGATHAVKQRILHMVMERQEETEEEAAAEAEKEKEGGGIASGLANLIIETVGIKEEAAERLAEALGIEIVEDEVSEG